MPMKLTQIPAVETLVVEFKSDRDKLGDGELVEAVVCLANTDGGAIYIGVEDDGIVNLIDVGVSRTRKGNTLP